ncbi:MAG: hypothetical protein OXI87_08395 [Albidovulum sp.]|nr:hypothetical protein [Albidovulum sp.]
MILKIRLHFPGLSYQAVGEQAVSQRRYAILIKLIVGLIHEFLPVSAECLEHS